MTNPHVTRLWCPSICHKLFGPATEYALLEITTAQRILEFPGSTRPILSLIRSRWTLRPIDRRCPDTKEYPTKVPWSLMNRSTRLSNCASEIMEKPVTSSSPYSTMRRLNVHRETRSIWAILFHVKPDDLRWRRTSSDIKYLGRPTLPDRETSGLFTEYTARFVQFDESGRIHCPCKRRIFPSISFSTALLILTKGRTCWRATIRYSSFIWMLSLTPTSAVFHSRSHSSRRSRAAEKRSCQCNTSIPLGLPSSAILPSE